MGLANDAETQARAKAFEQGLEREGWSAGQNLRIDYRFSEGDPKRMQAFAGITHATQPWTSSRPRRSRSGGILHPMKDTTTESTAAANETRAATSVTGGMVVRAIFVSA